MRQASYDERKEYKMSSLKQLSLWVVPLVFFGLSPILLNAQDNMGKNDMSVTGCLKQGTDKAGYYIMSDGKMYEVTAHGVNLAEHIGHTVTVTGHTVKVSEAQEAKKEASEKAEAGSSSYEDFQATSVKMVSATCSQ
jgi:hypothetical protein